MPLPTFARPPAPVSWPGNKLETLFPPTESVTAAAEPFASASVPELLRPPTVAAVIDPNDSVPAPEVSNVLPKRALALPSVSVPAETSVSPENVLVPVVAVVDDGTSVGVSVRLPAPAFVKARLPVMIP